MYNEQESKKHNILEQSGICYYPDIPWLFVLSWDESGKCEHTDDNNRVGIQCDIARRGVDCSNCQGLYDITCRRDVFRWSCLIEYKLHLYDRCVSNRWRTEKQIAFMMQQFDLHQSWILCAEFIAWHTDDTIYLKRGKQFYILFDPIQLNIDYFNWPSPSCIVWKPKHHRYKYKCSSLSQMSHDSLNSSRNIYLNSRTVVPTKSCPYSSWKIPSHYGKTIKHVKPFQNGWIAFKSPVT